MIVLENKTKNEKIAILSCVGQRSLAVISPLHTLIKQKNLKTEEISLFLFTTEGTKTQAEDCKAWFLEKYGGMDVNVMFFDQKNLKCLIDKAIKHASTVYFNTNPGMNWEISTLAIFLPENTLCIYADYGRLFIWEIEKDIKDADSYKILDLGLNIYNRFSEKNFYEENGINPGLSYNIQEFLQRNGLNKRFTVSGKNVPAEGEIAEFLKNRLVWVKESSGFIYLLFDFQLGDLSNLTVDQIKEKNKYYLNIYRSITEIFDPLNFTVAIITDSNFINTRAKVDGIFSYFFSKKNYDKFSDIISKWFTKKIIPKKVHYPANPLKNNTDKNYISTSKSALFVCLGDNIEPTLKAIYSHNLKEVYMFYDINSPRISFLAETIKKVERNFAINLIETDNKGINIYENIKKISSNLENIEINISPGTKSQGVALVQAARYLNKTDSLFSIDKDFIKKLTDPSLSYKRVISPSTDTLIKCHITPHRDPLPIPAVPPFLSIMEKLAHKEINPDTSIFKLVDKGRPIFQVIKQPSLGNYMIVKCNIDGKTYNIPNSFKDENKEGVWWDMVVAYTLKKKLNTKIFLDVTWDWPQTQSIGYTDNKKSHFTEIDIVFRWREFICAVSCKTGTIKGLNEITRFEIKSEADKRFGRFALPFVAIPRQPSDMQYKENDYKNLMKDDVMYLFPSLMIDSKKLIEAIDYFIESKRTTSSKFISTLVSS